MKKLIIFISILLSCLTPSLSIEPVSTTLAVGAVTATIVGMLMELTGYSQMKCNFKECCNEKTISLDSEGLRRDLNSRLHGQHLVIPTVVRAVSAHVKDPSPTKPLVLSFHGWTGGGKNYVSKLIVKNMFAKGDKSAFVHLFNSEIHFKHENKVPQYKDQLHSWIYHNVSACQRSLFIFDEMDHMPPGMIDVLVPFLGHNTHVDKVDFRKSIFIFLSNTGGDLITKMVLQQWKSGLPRSSLKLRDVQEILERGAYNQKSGLKRSKLIHKNLIDHFIPFLPLEHEHVRNCIIDEFRRQNVTKYDEDHITSVLDELQWFPKESQLYSKSGCKKISQKVAVLGIAEE